MGRPLQNDLTGTTKGMLSILKRIVRPGQRSTYLIRCECGTEREMSSTQLRGDTISCGCYKKLKKPRLTHGHSPKDGERTKTYKCWLSMRRRCNSPSAPNYHKYGGAGISVCERWDKSFEDFLSDMGEAPSDKHTIDRIDNEKGYSPDNCRWSTYAEQAQNQRRTVLDQDTVRLIRESTIPVPRLAEILGINVSAIYFARQGRTWKNVT